MRATCRPNTADRIHCPAAPNLGGGRRLALRDEAGDHPAGRLANFLRWLAERAPGVELMEASEARPALPGAFGLTN